MGHEMEIQQDGYDNGLVFTCHTCQESWPIKDESAHVYAVSTDRVRELVDNHYATMGDPN